MSAEDRLPYIAEDKKHSLNTYHAKFPGLSN